MQDLVIRPYAPLIKDHLASVVLDVTLKLEVFSQLCLQVFAAIHGRAQFYNRRLGRQERLSFGKLQQQTETIADTTTYSQSYRIGTYEQKEGDAARFLPFQIQ